jgi:pimeloyl-ACP methyl ester carboxylesterase
MEKVLDSLSGRMLSFDLTLPNHPAPAGGYPVLVFAHGFKGFKDWGFWYRFAEFFASEGFAFLKFNFAWNGTTAGKLLEFSDLEAFGNNNFSRELADLQSVLAWISGPGREYGLNPEEISLLAHSRGGPVALITAAENPGIRSVLTWGSVESLGYAWFDEEELRRWKEDGVLFIHNARTGQQMPLYYQLFEDFQRNSSRFSPDRYREITCPVLLIHGTADAVVPFHSAKNINARIRDSRVHLLEGADHVFGGRHPIGPEEELPGQAVELLEKSLEFLRGK